MSCKKTPCGCGDQPFPSTDPCNSPAECAGESCAELFCNECIVNCQPDISVEVGEGTFLNITQGMRMDEIIQKLMILTRDPQCLESAVIGLRLVSKSSTTILIKWIPVAGTTYTISWTEGDNTYTTDVHDVSQYEIINLIPNTIYQIKIITEITLCESVTMTITTNAS